MWIVERLGPPLLVALTLGLTWYWWVSTYYAKLDKLLDKEIENED